MIAGLARAGRLVVAIDTLPTRLAAAKADVHGQSWPTGCGGWTGTTTIGQLREMGVPVTAWPAPGSLDQVLRDMTRAGHGARGSVLR